MLTLRIAARYLFARKSHKAVNVIASVAVTGVAVAVAAMIVVLSVFNGFADLAGEHLSRLDPPLLVRRVGGAVMADADSVRAVLNRIPGIAATAPTLTRRALMVRGNTQTAVMFKAVPEGYDRCSGVRDMMIDGVYAEASDEHVPAAQISVGVANSLLQAPNAEERLHLYVPRRTGRINPANPGAAFRGSEVVVSGVFRVGQNDVDNDMIIVPLSVGRQLLEYDTQADAVEIYPAAGAGISDIRRDVSKALGPAYSVETRLEQRTEAFRMIAVEKWVTFMMLIFVVAIALFNIVATLSLLVIEKRDDMSTLRSLGATRTTVRRIFFAEGALVTAIGGAAGIVIGVIVSLAQQYGHWIKLGGDPSQVLVEWYPVHVQPVDIAIVAALTAVMAVLMGALASAMAARRLRTSRS